MKKRKTNRQSSDRWADSLTEKARKENYPARSVYKLKEIQKKFRVIRRGDTVLDLGCAPGSWLLYASEAAGRNGCVYGVDVKETRITLSDNITVYRGDIEEIIPGFIRSEEIRFNCVLSDMAPATTGRKDVDAARSMDLCLSALNTAGELLLPEGNFVCKIFNQAGLKQFETDVRAVFQETRIFRPTSCRKESKEIYIVGKGKI